MQRSWTIADVRGAIEEHMDAGHLVQGRHELAHRVVVALQGPAEVEYRGWWIRRKTAAEFSLEGDCDGWEAVGLVNAGGAAVPAAEPGRGPGVRHKRRPCPRAGW